MSVDKFDDLKEKFPFVLKFQLNHESQHGTTTESIDNNSRFSHVPPETSKSIILRIQHPPVLLKRCVDTFVKFVSCTCMRASARHDFAINAETQVTKPPYG